MVSTRRVRDRERSGWMPESGWLGLQRWIRRLKVRKAARVPTGSGSQNWMKCKNKKKVKLGRLVYSWSCSCPQLSCCIWCTVFSEPKGGKAPAKRLQENSRSRGSCRGASSLLVGTAAAAAGSLSPRFSWLSQQECHCFLGELVQAYSTKQPWWSEPCDTHVQCCVWAQLLHNHDLQNAGQDWEAVGQENLTTPSWLICSFPTSWVQVLTEWGSQEPFWTCYIWNVWSIQVKRSLGSWIHADLVFWEEMWWWLWFSHWSCPDSHNPLDCSPPGSCPWDFPSKNTRVGCHSLLQGIFPTQGSNTNLLHCRWILYSWAAREAREEVYGTDKIGNHWDKYHLEP